MDEKNSDFEKLLAEVRQAEPDYVVPKKPVVTNVGDNVVAISEKANTEYLDVVCLRDIEPQNQPWLWSGFIPSNAFTLFAGVGGLGKSQLLMFLAAHVSNGKAFNAGGISHTLPQGSVLLLSAEDSHKYSIVPRLQSLGANLENIHILRSVLDVKNNTSHRLAALDKDLLLVRSLINRLKDDNKQEVKLIVIDPIINFIGKVKDYINTEVSNFLYGLTELADEFNLSIIINKHLRKKDSTGVGKAMDEISGSHAWVNTARQVWIICQDHEDPTKILFLDSKSNIKKQMNGLAFNIVSDEILSKSGEIVKTSKIVWSDEVVTIKADEAVNKERYEKNKFEETKEFIFSHIETNGQTFIKDLSLKLKDTSERTIRRAYTELLKEGAVKKEKILGAWTLSLPL
jgi:hypothetical protein